MSIIRTHDITLYGGNEQYRIILRPLSDEYLPYLYKWNADPEVLYWTEGGKNENISYTPEIVHQIYGGISQANLCFVIEVNSEVIGECWLQKMNIEKVKAMYADDLDVRRIDMAIGEKAYWGKGIGTLFIKILVDFAFDSEHVDVLHCFCEDYNIRSRRVWEKNGFKLILSESLPQPQKGKMQYHWRLTHGEYLEGNEKNSYGVEDYSRHAAVWDWDGFDNTPEYEYWCTNAKKFGSKVLLPMCALGSVGAYMAQKGFAVTAFDLTKEMISEGKKRYGHIANLKLSVADICDFDFPCKSYDFVFLKDQDLHLLQTLEEVKRALLCINKHLRKDGCLVLELTLPMAESFDTPKQIFHPRKPNYPDKKVWKESECRYDATEKRNYINQTVYVETDSQVEHFNYSICLQYFEREVLLSALAECGFAVRNEYSDREKTVWREGEGFWSVEAIKV